MGIGNAHGLYKGRPNLDFQRLQEVRDVTDVPLVLHGGSGIPDDMIQTAIEIGIRKINVATEIRMAYVEGLLSGSANGDYYEMVKAPIPCAPPPPYEGPSRFKRTVLFPVRPAGCEAPPRDIFPPGAA